MNAMMVNPLQINLTSSQPAGEERFDFNQRPLVVIWEVTQACDLKCQHCRACAQPFRDLRELTSVEAKRLINEVAEMGAPLFVFTGGDPLKRPDIYQLVEYAAERGVHPSLTPSATPLLTREAVAKLKASALTRLAVSLDASTAAIHDGFRGVPGSWQRTVDVVSWAEEVGLQLQINTTVTQRNKHDLPAIAELLNKHKIALWSLFFLVPTGRGQLADMLSAEEAEEVFDTLYKLSKQMHFHIKTTEGQHYRRFVLQQVAGSRAANIKSADAPTWRPDSRPGVNDGKGFVFISHVGDVYPSGFLPMSGGNIRQQPLAEIYRESSIFRALRDPDCLKGKCGLCEFRNICGGSRARAFAVTGDMFAPDPCCVYEPKPLQMHAFGIPGVSGVGALR
ncbi:MAG TPA: TIGR04053 family radical SAM/SPASM domain-containing protein [Terriglobales bacterium]|nr:TIGR04053 family radical SAM/SPASM domain-containing protein [Terriglobales bacterium]